MLSTSIAKEPMAVFLYAVKGIKKTVPTTDQDVLDFLGFGDTSEEQAKEYLRNAKQNPK